MLASQIIKLYEMFPRGMSLVLVLEYMCSGLWDMLHQNQQELTLPRIKTYALMLLKGTRYMHAHYVMHRVIIHIMLPVILRH